MVAVDFSGAVVSAHGVSEAPAAEQCGCTWAAPLEWWQAPSLQSLRGCVEQSLCVSQDVHMLVSSCGEVQVAPPCWQERGWPSAEIKSVFYPPVTSSHGVGRK